MPLHGRLHTDVVNGLRPIAEANARVFSAMYPERLSLSHSICAGALGTFPKRCSTAASMNVAHYVAVMTACCRCPAHCFTVATIERERHAQRLAVVAMKLETVRAPSLIASGHRHRTFMPTLDARPRRPPVKRQIVLAHHAINTFRVHWNLASQFPPTSQQAPDPSIAVARQG